MIKKYLLWYLSIQIYDVGTHYTCNCLPEAIIIGTHCIHLGREISNIMHCNDII